MSGRESKIKLLEFEWDEFNKEKNWIKHHVNYKECEEVFTNRPLKTYEDILYSQEEDRYTALGITNLGKKLYMVYTVRKGKIRIISARVMSRKERKLYETK